MTTENLTLFKALGAKMDYLNQRQRVIAQNVANSDTPGYKPKDLVKADFSQVLKNINAQGRMSVSPKSTNSRHILLGSDVDDPKSRKQKHTYEVAPAGNAVIMEEQLINANQTVMDYNLMSNLYQKQVAMIKTALGTRR